MAASDNHAAAAADLRRLASLDEATLQGALSHMGRDPFRRLRRAVGRTGTPDQSDAEGGSGPSGAQVASDPYRLDPAVNAENQVTAPSGANLNNLDPANDTYAFLAAVSSPVASMATQDPLWPPSLGDTTALDDYLAEPVTAPAAGGTMWTSAPSAPTAGSSSSPAAAPTTMAAPDAQLGDAPPTLGEGTPAQGEGTVPERPPTPGAPRSRANKILPTATGAEQTVRQLADQIDTAAKPPTKAVPRKQPPACFATLGAPKKAPPTDFSKAAPPPLRFGKPPPPGIVPCALLGDQVQTPETPSTLPAQGADDQGRSPPTHQWWRPAGRI